MKRYYYKKDGKAAYNIKEPLSNILADTTGYIEITKAEWDNLTRIEPHVLSAEEMARAEKCAQIAELKAELARTDYQAIKYAEGWISKEDYADIKAHRQSLRDQINELEGQL